MTCGWQGPGNTLAKAVGWVGAGPHRRSVVPLESGEQSWTPARSWDQLGMHSGEGPPSWTPSSWVSPHKCSFSSIQLHL